MICLLAFCELFTLLFTAVFPAVELSLPPAVAFKEASPVLTAAAFEASPELFVFVLVAVELSVGVLVVVAPALAPESEAVAVAAVVPPLAAVADDPLASVAAVVVPAVVVPAPASLVVAFAAAVVVLAVVELSVAMAVGSSFFCSLNDCTTFAVTFEELSPCCVVLSVPFVVAVALSVLLLILWFAASAPFVRFIRNGHIIMSTITEVLLVLLSVVLVTLLLSGGVSVALLWFWGTSEVVVLAGGSSLRGI